MRIYLSIAAILLSVHLIASNCGSIDSDRNCFDEDDICFCDCDCYEDDWERADDQYPESIPPNQAKAIPRDSSRYNQFILVEPQGRPKTDGPQGIPERKTRQPPSLSNDKQGYVRPKSTSRRKTSRFDEKKKELCKPPENVRSTPPKQYYKRRGKEIHPRSISECVPSDVKRNPLALTKQHYQRRTKQIQSRSTIECYQSYTERKKRDLEGTKEEMPSEDHNTSLSEITTFPGCESPRYCKQPQKQTVREEQTVRSKQSYKRRQGPVTPRYLYKAS